MDVDFRLCFLATIVVVYNYVLLCAAMGFDDSRPVPNVDSVCQSLNMTIEDRHSFQAALNLEYLETDFFLWASYGYGLDVLSPGQAEGGPLPIGVCKANLGPYYDDLFMQLGLQEIGHLRAIKKAIGQEFSIPRPLMNLSRESFAEVMDMAVGKTLNPPFDLYANSLNYLLASYVIPNVGLTAYVGAVDILGSAAKLLLHKLLAVEAAQDAIIRNELYRRRDEEVVPYDITTAQFTEHIANLRNRLADQVLNEGIVVPKAQGAYSMTTGNILPGDGDSIAYASSSPEQFFGFLYLTGSATEPGGFYPNGANGIHAQNYLHP